MAQATYPNFPSSAKRATNPQVRPLHTRDQGSGAQRTYSVQIKNISWYTLRGWVVQSRLMQNRPARSIAAWALADRLIATSIDGGSIETGITDEGASPAGASVSGSCVVTSATGPGMRRIAARRPAAIAVRSGMAASVTRGRGGADGDGMRRSSRAVRRSRGRAAQSSSRRSPDFAPRPHRDEPPTTAVRARVQAMYQLSWSISGTGSRCVRSKRGCQAGS